MCNHDRHEPVSRETGLDEDEDLLYVNTPPVFAELLLRMIDELPDDVVSWSVAGDSFVIKKMLAFEELLPSYYNHGNFSSFARQLNNYGFQRIKRTSAARERSTGGGIPGAGAATTRQSPWDEFGHPLFRRGRRDLLVGISRHRAGVRLKPTPDLQELGMLNSLRADVGALSGDLRTANGKLENIMSLLSDVARCQNQPATNNTNRVAVVSAGGGGGSGFEGGNVMGSAAAPVEADRGGRVGFGGWAGEGGRESDGGMGRGGQGSGAVRAPSGYFVGPSASPVGHRPERTGGHPFHHPPSQATSSTERYPVGPDQVYGEAVPPLAGAVIARASEGGSTGPYSHQQLPPQHRRTARPEKSPNTRGAPFL